jgi:hypothetical protein
MKSKYKLYSQNFFSRQNFRPSVKLECLTSGLYYKHITIINDDSSIINKWRNSFTDDTRIIIYYRYNGHRIIEHFLPYLNYCI